ncbi:MAG: zinc-ribbon domain-containing protein, partial [Catenulispora sp.]
MIVCKNCGTHNQDSEKFCGTCGRFLEWTGEKVAPTPSPQIMAEAEEVAARPKRSLLARMQDVLFLDVGPKEAQERASGPGGPPGMGLAGMAPPRPGPPGPPRPP